MQHNNGYDILRDVDVSGHNARLTTWDTQRVDNRGKTIIAYRFEVAGAELFAGEDYAASPMHADDSDKTLLGLLGFLTIRPGDTDRDYFDAYTPAQLAWAESSECERLQCDVAIASDDETSAGFLLIDRDTEWHTVVFLQSDHDFDGFVCPETGATGERAFFEAGFKTMVDYLAQWDCGEYGPDTSNPLAEPRCRAEYAWIHDQYLLVANPAMGYAGLYVQA